MIRVSKSMARSINVILHKLFWLVRIPSFCIGLIFAFHLLKLSIPYSFNLVRSTLTGLWLYMTVNIIILTVGAASIYNHHNLQALEDDAADPGFDEKMSVANESTSALIAVEEKAEEEEALVPAGTVEHYGSASQRLSHEEEERPLPPPTSDASHTLSDSIPSGAPDNSINTQQESNKLRVTDTEISSADNQLEMNKGPADIEATWKAITTKPQLRKSGTWNASARLKAEVGNEHLKKWETFNKTRGSHVGTNYMRKPTLGGREAWMSQEELNSRVEAFINTFNEKLRLQRQESDQHYSDLLHLHQHQPATSLALN